MATLISMASSPNCKQQVEVFVSQNRKIMDIYKKHMEIRGGGSGNYLPIIKELVVYMSRTFHEENMIMMQTNYPAFVEHAKAHQKFTQTIEEFLKSYERGDNDLGFKIFIFLKNWIRDHISKLDVDCAIYLRKNGFNLNDSDSESLTFDDSLLAVSTMG